MGWRGGGSKSKGQLFLRCQKRRALTIEGINCGLMLGFFCNLFKELLLTTKLYLELRYSLRKKEKKNKEKAGQMAYSSFELHRAIDFSLRVSFCSQEEGERGESNSLIRAEGHVHLLASCHIPLFSILNVY